MVLMLTVAAQRGMAMVCVGRRPDAGFSVLVTATWEGPDDVPVAGFTACVTVAAGFAAAAAVPSVADVPADRAADVALGAAAEAAGDAAAEALIVSWAVTAVTSLLPTSKQGNGAGTDVAAVTGKVDTLGSVARAALLAASGRFAGVLRLAAGSSALRSPTSAA